MTVTSERHAVALMDAGHGMGHIAGTKAMMLAMEKAKYFGVGIVAVRRSNHYGAAGVYSNIARRGFTRNEYDRDNTAICCPDLWS